MVVPDCCGGTSISVTPDDGRNCRYPILGIATDAEQSNVPFVFIRKTVGISAFAALSFGEYPPLASISTICFPSVTDTFATLGASPLPPLEPAKRIAPPMRAPAIITAIAVFMLLEVEDWRHQSDDHQAIDEVKDCKHDDDETCCLEEDACL